MIVLGVEADVAKFALQKVNYQSVERAFGYIYDKENGKYEHEFIRINEELCKICMEPLDVHISY